MSYRAISKWFGNTISRSSGLSTKLAFKEGRRHFFNSSTCLPEKVKQGMMCHQPASLTRLSNGLRVVTFQLPNPMVSVGVFVNYGSRDETYETNGVAHFLEHMMFKGTHHRSRTFLEKEIENMGGQLNAYTSREQTVFSSRVFKNDVGQALEILADILTQSKIQPEAIEEEKYVIFREMEEVDKSCEEVIFDQLHLACYKGHPLHFPILGLPEGIAKMERSMLMDAFRHYYTAEHMVIVGVGDLNHQSFVNLVQNYFRSVSQPLQSSPSQTAVTPQFTSCHVTQRSDQSDLTHAVVALEAVGWNHPAQPEFLLLQSLCGQYDTCNSPIIPADLSLNTIVRTVAQKLPKDASFTFNSFATYYKDTGLFGFYATGSQDIMDQALESLINCLSFLTSRLTEAELNLAKRNLQHQLLQSIDTTTALCDEIGRQILVYGRYIPLATLLERVNRITLQNFRLFMSQRLNLSKLAVITRGISDVPLPSLRRLQNL